MTENKKTILLFALFLALVIVVGCVGGDCVKECQESGHSEAVCLNICRP